MHSALPQPHTMCENHSDVNSKSSQLSCFLPFSMPPIVTLFNPSFSMAPLRDSLSKLSKCAK